MSKAVEEPLQVVNTGDVRFGIGPGPKWELKNGKQVLRERRTPGVAFFDSKHDDNVEAHAKAAGIDVQRFGRRHKLTGDHAATLRALPKAFTDRIGLEVKE